MGPIRSLDDLLDMVRRRARLMLRVFTLGCIFSVLLALSQKHLYQSAEVMQFTGPPVGRSSVAGITDAHLRLLRQRLMTRANLLEVIDAYNLYAEYPEMKPEEMVERLRQSVRIDGGGGTEGPVSTLTVTAQMPIAVQAKQVADELSRRTITLDENVRIAQSRDALTLLNAQEDRLADEMLTLDAQVRTVAKGNDAIVLARRMQSMRRELALVSGHRVKAEIAYRLETQGKARRLRVIEQAAFPERPLANSRRQIAVVGSVMSVIAALALAFALELRHPVIRTARQMQRETGFGPLVSIPSLNMTPPKTTLWQRFLVWLDGPEPSDDPA